MHEIDTLDIRAFAANAIANVFDTMFSMEVVILNNDLHNLETGKHIVGSVSFAGDAIGNVTIYITDRFARRITSAMLNIEVDDIESDEEVYDVIGELCNMIGGDLKSRLCDYGYPCLLSIPAVTSGNDFTIKSKGWMREERFGFTYQKNTGLVEIYMKFNK